MKALFTSIKKLRNSTALQSRVTDVAQHLRTLNKGWKDDWWFPIIAVGLSNPREDVSWVNDHERQHLDADVVSVRTTDGAAVNISVSALVTDMEHTVSRDVTSSTHALQLLDRVNAILSRLAGGNVVWTNGVHEMDPNASTAASGSEMATMGRVADIAAEVTPDVIAQLPLEVAYQELMKLDPSDVLAVIMRINEAKGPLLKNSTHDEQVALVKLLTGDKNVVVM